MDKRLWTVQVFGCNKCGHVNKEFMPEGEIDETKNSI